jgi:hypothetical protein
MTGLAPQDRRRACFIGAQRHGIIYYYVYVLARSDPVPSDDDINTILTAFNMDDGHGHDKRAIKSAIADYQKSLKEREKYKPFGWTEKGGRKHKLERKSREEGILLENLEAGYSIGVATTFLNEYLRAVAGDEEPNTVSFSAVYNVLKDNPCVRWHSRGTKKCGTSDVTGNWAKHRLRVCNQWLLRMQLADGNISVTNKKFLKSLP